MRLPRGWSRRTAILVGVLGLLIGAVVVDALVLTTRITDVEVALPDVDDGVETWVIVGSDSRSALADGTTEEQFGSTDDVPDARADLILLLVETAEQTSLITVPRDLLVTVDDFPYRLGMTLLNGPQVLIDTLCTSLGVPADHYVQVEFGGFASIVDALGGITVELPYPVRDAMSGLDLPEAGTQEIDALTALALVRSRNAEQYVDGQWVLSESGPDDRATWGGVVLRAMVDKATEQKWNPVALQRLAWAATGAITTDSDTGIFDLIGVPTDVASPIELPHDPPQVEPKPGQAVPLPPNDDTTQTLVNAGLGGTCTPASK